MESFRGNFAALDSLENLPQLLLSYAVLSAALYLIRQPQIMAVTLIEYIKAPPELAVNMIVFSTPYLLAFILAKVLAANLSLAFRIVLGVFSLTCSAVLTIFGFAFLAVERTLGYFSESSSRLPREIREATFSHAAKPIEFLKKRIENDRAKTAPEPSRGTRLLHSFLLLIFLFGGRLAKEPHWGFYNRTEQDQIAKIANLHYYCQLTGTYNQSICQEWVSKKD